MLNVIAFISTCPLCNAAVQICLDSSRVSLSRWGHRQFIIDVDWHIYNKKAMKWLAKLFERWHFDRTKWGLATCAKRRNWGKTWEGSSPGLKQTWHWTDSDGALFDEALSAALLQLLMWKLRRMLTVHLRCDLCDVAEGMCLCESVWPMWVISCLETALCDSWVFLSYCQKYWTPNFYCPTSDCNSSLLFH